MSNRKSVSSFWWNAMTAALGATLAIIPPVASTPWWARAALVAVFCLLVFLVYWAQHREQRDAEARAAALRQDDRAERDEDRAIRQDTHRMLVELVTLERQRNALIGRQHDVSVTESVSATDTGAVEVTPGTGELKYEGFAPTVSVESLEKRIAEQSRAVIQQLQRVYGKIET